MNPSTPSTFTLDIQFRDTKNAVFHYCTDLARDTVMLLSDLEEVLNRQASEMRTLSDDVSAMETELQQLILALSQLDPQSTSCTVR